MDAKEVVQGITEKWARAFNSGSAKDVAALFAENAYFSSARTAPLTSRKAIEKHFEEIIKRGMKITIGIQEARVAGNGVIVAIGDFSFKGSGGDEMMAGNWGHTTVGSSNEIALHISNMPISPSK